MTQKEQCFGIWDSGEYGNSLKATSAAWRLLLDRVDFVCRVQAYCSMVGGRRNRGDPTDCPLRDTSELYQVVTPAASWPGGLKFL